jgi:hypothetical protein
MSDKTEEARQRAETKFEKVKNATRESDKVWAQHEAEGRAVRARTARLKTLRLAKEAADLEAAALVVKPVKPAARKKKAASAAPKPASAPAR